MDTITSLRYFNFIAGVLENQQHDPYCSSCRALTNSLNEIRQKMNSYLHENSAELSDIPEAFALMPADIKTIMSGIRSVADAVGQKKAGNCALPQGVCFVKSSKALIEKLSQE